MHQENRNVKLALQQEECRDLFTLQYFVNEDVLHFFSLESLNIV